MLLLSVLEFLAGLDGRGWRETCGIGIEDC